MLGLLCYTAFHQRGAQKGFACAVIVGLLAVMIWKYVSLDIIDPIYGGTDANIVEILKNWGLDSYSKSLAERLLRAYQIYAR